MAVPLVVSAHVHHRATAAALDRLQVALAGHAVFETFSVLTRLPPPLRRSPETIRRLLAADFAPPVFLSPAGARDLWERLPAAGITGGAVYDALVGAVALEQGTRLVTRDRRALSTYRALGVPVDILP